VPSSREKRLSVIEGSWRLSRSAHLQPSEPDPPASLFDRLEELREILHDEQNVLQPIDLEWLGEYGVE
jgi:hypothetical protein